MRLAGGGAAFRRHPVSRLQASLQCFGAVSGGRLRAGRRVCLDRGRWRIGGINIECSLRERNCLADTLRGEFVEVRQRAEIQVVGIEAFGWLTSGSLDLREPQPW